MTENRQTRRRTDSLVAAYDGVICDLDGVVYRGPTAVPGAVETVNEVAADQVGVAFATNNASRPPDEVAAHLRELGVDGHGWSVVTSSQAAAAYLAQRLRTHAPVLAVGGPGVSKALTEVGLVPLRVRDLTDTRVEAVVQGLGVDVTWRELAEVGYLAQRGVTWVATNLDLFLPTADGPAPGNGALVAAVRAATSAVPHVVGKPGPALFDLARAGLGTSRERTIACGDRLDTDIAGATAAGLDSLLVLSGASRLQDLAFATGPQRPTYVAADLSGLRRSGLRLDAPPPDPAPLAPTGVPRVPAGGDQSGRLHAVVTAAWTALDAGLAVSADRETWQAVEQQLGLAGVPVAVA
ncbi:HAD-IIA family hydrolase [Nocardioides aquiterrae]|uniref:HAD-IIA family hydrolase n=1 Tax=Nocardioides aquiterrae TaxID=203799 RepID=A0ABN1U9E0_9ACTN